ncbi:MFS transporter [Micromonospora sp. CB01531]|uniref:MFS transporter n=1 Tax=Micromonospora sp. CB01531 TaxID=1718947 RepID=UPI00093C6039|nr:MFS transporter [Micromonospora sp. CB01531]OKI71681.1 EmrB/QacA family drug resistance transporter [Micromonospora sp. CB01531]
MTRPRTRPSPSPAETPAEPRPIAGRARTIALFAVLVGLLLDLLDIVIVNVALPTIQEDIGASSSNMQWMVGGYTLAFATMLVTGGRLGDIYGRKRIFIIGMTGFAAASLVAGIAVAPEQMIVARFVQGGMGALMVPQVLSILQVMYPPNDRGRAFSALSVVFAVGTVGGPVVGALLTASNVGGLTWRTIFLVNLPIAVGCLVITAKLVPESRGKSAQRLDVQGAVLVGLGMLLLVFPLIQGPEQGWPVWTLASLAASVLAFAALVAVQRRRTVSPLIPMSLFSHRSFRGGLAVSLFFMSGVMPFFLVNTLYLQFGQGFSVIKAGLIGVLWGFAVPLFTAISARRITPKLGRLGLQLGLVMLIAAMVILITVIHRFDTATPWALAPGLILGGAGMGMTFAPLLTYTLNDVPLDSAGAASGVFNTVQQMGAAIGIALSSMVFFLVLGAQSPAVGDDLSATVKEEMTARGLPVATVDTAAGNARACFTGRIEVANPIADLDTCRAVPAQSGAADPGVADMHDKLQFLANRTAYQQTTERALLYQILVFTLAIAASFLLPRRVQQQG